MRRSLLLPLCVLFAAGPVHAQTSVFRCVDASGNTAYQAQPCETARGDKVRLHVAPAQAPASRPSAWKGYVPPKEAALVFYYDPKEEPVGFSTPRMEAMIRQALAAWGAGCQVRLAYGGLAAARPRSTAEFVSVRWAPEYLFKAHPADGRSGIAGTGGPTHGIALRPKFHEHQMLAVLVHEVGHVLGLPHNHDDPRSVMSYLRHDGGGKADQPSAADHVACNLAMKKRFGIDYTPPADAPAADAPRMSGREALERIRQRRAQGAR